MDLSVTPFVGVWIETNLMSSIIGSGKKSHPSWVCGLKPPRKWWRTSLRKSHPSWVCGLKHYQALQEEVIILCHTLRGCVDWNDKKIIINSAEEGHTLRGCVDWNFPNMPCIAQRSRSHPSWVCGLKQRWCTRDLLRWRHTLRGCVDWNLYVPFWLCSPYVTPFVGVWIETLTSGQHMSNDMRHTLRGCVDWNTCQWNRPERSHCHTLRGCVDWNLYYGMMIFENICHTLRGCVDWNTPKPRLNKGSSSHTLRGCVDWNENI